jgi:hypothetical protein
MIDTAAIPAPLIDSEARTITFAVTLHVDEPWAVDACRAAAAGIIARALDTAFDGNVGTPTTVTTYDPHDDRLIVIDT